MCCLVELHNAAEVVQPVESWLVALESGEQGVDHVGSLPDGLGQFVPHEVGSVIDRQLLAVFILHEREILLNIVSEPEDVAVLATDRH